MPTAVGNDYRAARCWINGTWLTAASTGTLKRSGQHPLWDPGGATLVVNP